MTPASHWNRLTCSPIISHFAIFAEAADSCCYNPLLSPQKPTIRIGLTQMTTTQRPDPFIVQRVRQSLDSLRKELLDQRVAGGYWVGELSPSSLSTATAISALAANLIHSSNDEKTEALPTHPPFDPKGSISRGNQESSRPTGRSTSNNVNPITREVLIAAVITGIDALRAHQNEDGGFGDTDRSHSNIATSYLVLAASTLANRAVQHSLSDEQIRSLKGYIEKAGAFEGLKERYGTDKTFVVPILTNLAIAGLVPWEQVPALPFEAAAFPQSMYRLLRMPVVSYAIPALVAIGQTRHFHGPKSVFPLRAIRSLLIERTMKVLDRMQPESGGFLEATPLTAFVVMSLAVTGRANHIVCENGLRFLLDSVDDKGLWPIDTNLATWVTSLSMHALSCDPEDDGSWCTESLISWHLKCQHRKRHPFTGAEPGGWGWSDLSGAVPDSDDTPAAILALREATRWNHSKRSEIHQAVHDAISWLKRLQNRNGGWPTFCRGWGKLPFDRSSNDLTAHALRAIKAASEIGIKNGQDASLKRAKQFLTKNQQLDGSWLPLWFGNQDREDESNPIYGTAKVLAAAVHFLDDKVVERGSRYLISEQNSDGGWGGGESVTKWLDKNSTSKLPSQRKVTSSMEETALAVDALITVAKSQQLDLFASRASQDCSSSIPVNPLESHHWQENPRTSSVESTPKSLPSAGGSTVKVSVENTEKWPVEGITEETAGLSFQDAGKEVLSESIIRGVEFLVAGIDLGQHQVPWPIGFYFAKLWYHEKLYPHIFTASALGKFLRISSPHMEEAWPI